MAVGIGCNPCGNGKAREYIGKPVINILEPAGFTLLVVNAQHIKYVRKHPNKDVYLGC